MRQSEKPKDYCLRCHRKLKDPAQKSCHCEFCGFNNFLSDRKKYWTLSPLLVKRCDRAKKVASIGMAFALPLIILCSMAGLQVFSIPLLVLFAPPILWISSGRLLTRDSFPSPILWTALFGILIFTDYSHLATNPSDPLIQIGLVTTLSIYGLGFLLSIAIFVRRKKWQAQALSHPIPLSTVDEFQKNLPKTDRGNAKYCLKCFAPMPAPTGNCSQCHFSNIAIDRRIYWNKNPKILAIETTGKVFAVCGGLFFTVLTVFGLRHTGMGAGYALAMNAVFVYAVCLSFGKLSRHMPSFEPSKVWSSMFWILLVTMTPLALVPHESDSVKAGVMIICLFLALLPLWWAKKFQGWKRHLQMADGAQLETGTKIEN